MHIVASNTSGIMPLTWPDFSLFPAIIGDAISIGVVGVALTISVERMYAKKHAYRIDPQQELYAFGREPN